MTVTEYNHCVDQWADGLYRFAMKSIADTEEAKDMVQQGFETLWLKREEVPPDKAKSFLFTVVHRRCMDVHRIRKKIISTEQIQDITIQPENKNELKNYLNHALNQLTPQARTLVLLKDYEGYNYEEIGTITKLSASQVKVYLHRARKLLKNYLIKQQQQL